MRGKRGISPVIATVLILVLTFVAISIIAAFVIPFVQNSIEDTSSCFDVVGDLKIDNTPYNCYVEGYGDSQIDRTGFSVRIDSEEVVAFDVSLYTGGKSDAVEITEGYNGLNLDPVIRMLVGDGIDEDSTLSIPAKGGIRTYVADGAFDRVEIFPVLSSGKKCKASDEIQLNPCPSGSEAESLVGQH